MNLCVSYPADGGLAAKRQAWKAASPLVKHYHRFCRRLNARGINWDIPVYADDYRVCFSAGDRWVQLEDWDVVYVRQLLQMVGGGATRDRMAWSASHRRAHTMELDFASNQRRRGEFGAAKVNLWLAREERRRMNEKGIPSVL